MLLLAMLKSCQVLVLQVATSQAAAATADAVCRRRPRLPAGLHRRRYEDHGWAGRQGAGRLARLLLHYQERRRLGNGASWAAPSAGTEGDQWLRDGSAGHPAAHYGPHSLLLLDRGLGGAREPCLWRTCGNSARVIGFHRDWTFCSVEALHTIMWTAQGATRVPTTHTCEMAELAAPLAEAASSPNYLGHPLSRWDIIRVP